jgi:hypothetical protein
MTCEKDLVIISLSSCENFGVPFDGAVFTQYPLAIICDFFENRKNLFHHPCKKNPPAIARGYKPNSVEY